MFVSFVANLFHEFVDDLGSLVWPGGMRGAITIKIGLPNSIILAGRTQDEVEDEDKNEDEDWDEDEDESEGQAEETKTKAKRRRAEETNSVMLAHWPHPRK